MRKECYYVDRNKNCITCRGFLLYSLLKLTENLGYDNVGYWSHKIPCMVENVKDPGEVISQVTIEFYESTNFMAYRSIYQ